MTKRIPSVVLAGCIAAILPAWMPTAQAKQQCSAATPENPRGHWSWRMIDGRKCWYQGEPMLAKSSLEWPAQASPRSSSDEGVASAVAEEARDPLDAQASVGDSFEARWRALHGLGDKH